VKPAPLSDRRSLRKAIVRKIEHIATEAATKGIAGELPSADIERIKALQRTLVALPEKAVIPLHWAALIGLACLVVASVALAFHVPWTRVQLDLTTTSVAMRVDNDFSWHGVWHMQPKQVKIQNFTRIELPPEYGQKNETSLELNVVNGRMGVDYLFFGHGTSITIATNETGMADIVAAGAPFRGNMEISGEVSGRAGLALNENLPLKNFETNEPPGHFVFLYDGQVARGGQPPSIQGTPVEILTLYDIGVTSLNFEEELPKPGAPDQIIFNSQISSGTITMTDINEQITLNPSAILRLMAVRGRITDLRLGSQGVRVKFEGTANSITLGNGDFARNLKPTILEWLIHQQKLGLFWGALTFLWGIFWSVRRLISGVA